MPTVQRHRKRPSFWKSLVVTLLIVLTLMVGFTWFFSVDYVSSEGSNLGQRPTATVVHR